MSFDEFSRHVINMKNLTLALHVAAAVGAVNAGDYVEQRGFAHAGLANQPWLKGQVALRHLHPRRHELVAHALAQRQAARQARDFQRADALRQEFAVEPAVAERDVVEFAALLRNYFK